MWNWGGGVISAAGTINGQEGAKEAAWEGGYVCGEISKMAVGMGFAVFQASSGD